MMQFDVNDQSKFGFHARNSSRLIHLIHSLGVKVYIVTDSRKHDVDMFSLMYLKERQYKVIVKSDDYEKYRLIYEFFNKEFMNDD